MSANVESLKCCEVMSRMDRFGCKACPDLDLELGEVKYVSYGDSQQHSFRLWAIRIIINHDFSKLAANFSNWPRICNPAT